MEREVGFIYNIANNLQGFTSHSAPPETYRSSSTKVIMNCQNDYDSNSPFSSAYY